MQILVSAGEASGDLYAAELVMALRQQLPEATFFGCTGPRMRSAGVETIVDAASLSVVGLLEVVRHLPRIWGEYRKLLKAATERRPVVAILTDSPDFHLRVANRLRKVPVVQLIAPQVWAWRTSRVRQMRRNLAKVLCIFPFEEAFFAKHGVPASYIGHPLVRRVGASRTRSDFYADHQLDPAKPLIMMLPGSRLGEVHRHLEPLADAADALAPRANLVLATPSGFGQRTGPTFWERISSKPIKVIEGETWDAIASADVALAASGTVTVETALLGTPMVTYYRVHPISWKFGRRLVQVPYLTMVNLIAGREVVPELMQDQMTGERIAAEALSLLESQDRRDAMKRDLAAVRAQLTTPVDPIERAAEIVFKLVEKEKEKR